MKPIKSEKTAGQQWLEPVVKPYRAMPPVSWRCVVFSILVCFLELATAAAQVPAISNFTQLERLSPSEVAQGRLVQFSGVVLCYDRDWGQLYVHDGTLTRYFSPQLFTNTLNPGSYVEIKGKTTLVEGRAGLTNLDLAILGRRVIPEAKRLRLPQLAEDFGQWVEIQGRVRAADNSRGRLGMTLHSGGRDCLVYVLGTQTGQEIKRLLDSEVRIRGINASKTAQGLLESAMVFAPGFDEVRILDAAPELTELPVVTIDALLNRELGGWTNRLVRVNGLISAYKPGESIVVRDPTGMIRAETTQMTRARPEERVDLWGFLSVDPKETVLKFAYFEVMHSPEPAPSEFAPTVPSTVVSHPTEPLTVVSNIINLPRDMLARHLPVRLQGVITYADPEFRNGFFQDDTDAIYVDLTQADVRAGQWVELSGRTDPGGFAPQINDAVVRILGTTNLPAAVKADLDDLSDGRWDAHWVELSGVVRRAEVEWGRLYLSLTSRKGSFRTIIPGFGNRPAPQRLVDAMVSMPGSCTSEVNARGQLTGITLHTPSLDYIRILDPVPDDPFAIETRPIARVSTFDARQSALRRVKVGGTVTLVQQQSGFFLQDDSGGVHVSTLQTNSLQIGDRVEVLGFAAMGDFSPSLEEASFRRVGSGVVPAAKKTTAEEILLRGKTDGQLVELEARLVQDIPRAARPRLVLQDGPIIFRAHLEQPDSGRELQELHPGSLLRLRGVCVVQGGERHEPEAFRLLIARNSDIRLLSKPTWWTTRHGLMLAGGMALATALSLTWVMALRMRVRSQTEVIRQKLEERKQIEGELLEISAQERRRLGHELHDGLGQHLTGVALTAKLLEENLAAENSREVSRTKKVVALINDAIHQTRLIAHGLDPVHVEAGGLVPALAKLSAQTGELYHIDCAFACPQERLDPKLETGHALYRITQEAIRNAVVHGRARRVEVRLEARDAHLCLSIRDDGNGFPANAKPQSGMGLHIMRYRAGSIGGSLQIESAQPKGAIVRCRIPLDNCMAKSEKKELHEQSRK